MTADGAATEPAGPTVHVDDRGPVRVLTLDRPHRRNALDHATLEALRAGLAGAEPAVDGGAVRVLVLTGSAGHFCAGADLSGVEDEHFVALLSEVLGGLRSAPFPTLAAVEGAALGAGTQLAAACDLRMATGDARFGVPASRLGLMVDAWTVQRVAALVGQSMARHLLLTPDTMTGERAHDLGFVHRLGGLDAAFEWADELAALAPLTIAGHKAGLNELDPAGPAGAGYRAAFERAWSSRDLQEGLAAFRERRPPSFEGR